ncbi:MAG: T9SS type A sorting domain-containing protein [Flavobacteriales bacterium]
MEQRIQVSLMLALGMLITNTASAQIPNGGFENWDDHGTYMEPAGGWLTYNDIVTPVGPWITVERGTPGAVGNYYASVTSRILPDTSISTSVLQGWLSLNGFSFTGRPAALTGQWQYGIEPSDTAEVLVFLARWNSAGDVEVVAEGSLEVTGSLSGWHPLSVPLTYFSAQAPDSAYIQFSASKDLGASVAGSFLRIDDLAFTGSVGVEEQQLQSRFIVFPSPASNLLSIEADQRITELKAMDMTGRTVLEQKPGTERVGWDVSNLNKGSYIVRVRLADGAYQVRSFMKQ